MSFKVYLHNFLFLYKFLSVLFMERNSLVPAKMREINTKYLREKLNKMQGHSMLMDWNTESH